MHQPDWSSNMLHSNRDTIQVPNQVTTKWWWHLMHGEWNLKGSKWNEFARFPVEICHRTSHVNWRDSPWFSSASQNKTLGFDEYTVEALREIAVVGRSRKVNWAPIVRSGTKVWGVKSCQKRITDKPHVNWTLPHASDSRPFGARFLKVT